MLWGSIRPTSGLDGCDKQIARQELSQSVLETNFAGERFLQEAHEEMA